MSFWLFMTLMNLLIPVTMVVLGRLFIKNPPKTINSIYGYRSNKSMVNQDTWKFAHKYCGKLWLKLGIVLFLVTIIPMSIISGKGNEIIGKIGGIIVLVQLFILIGSIIPVESALKRNFDEDGNTKKKLKL